MDLMQLLLAILVIVIVGLLLAWINRHLQMEPNVKTILNWFVIIALIIALALWLMRVFGLSLGNLRIG